MKITNLIAIGNVLSYNVIFCHRIDILVEYTLFSLKCCNFVVCFKGIYSKNKPIQTHKLLRISELNEFN